MKQKGGKDDNGEAQALEVTVYDYFVNYRHIELRYSADLPCINVGKPKRPTYIPLEVIHQVTDKIIYKSFMNCTCVYVVFIGVLL